MTVQELIDRLSKMTDVAKAMPVGIVVPEFSCGGTGTGMYCFGETCVLVDEVKFRDGDEFAALTDLDKIAHVEVGSSSGSIVWR